MNQLQYKLIYHIKNKRWLHILEAFEENQIVTAYELASELKCSKRTIQSDIKEMKKYFDSTIMLFGDLDGYHFSFREPLLYMDKKQALLDREYLFIVLDHLIEDKRKTNKEWAKFLSVSTASFGRMKRILVQLLNNRYHVKIVEKDNRLAGGEAAIRQLMYDFYFTLPIYPKEIKEKIDQLPPFDLLINEGCWAIDSVRMSQWGKIARWRIKYGKYLPESKSIQDVQGQLVKAFDDSVEISMPAQEKAALFLLSLNETQFLNPLVQKDFIRNFSPSVHNIYPIKDFDGMTAYFFEIFIFLMKNFFQLSINGDKENIGLGKLDERTCLKYMIDTYLERKKQLEKSVYLDFNLTGTSALKEWIESVVRQHLCASGFYLIEVSQMTPYTRRISITNIKQQRENPGGIYLTAIPDRAEIQRKLQTVEW